MNRLLLAGLLLMPALGCDRTSAAPANAPAPAKTPRAYRVTVQAVARRRLAYEVNAIGALEAHQVVPIAARVDGNLENLAFNDGDPVTPDQVLAEIDTVRFTLRVRDAEAAVARAKAALARAHLQSLQQEATIARMAAQTARAEATLQEAQANLARRKDLASGDAGSVSKEEISTYEAMVAKARAELDMAHGGEGETRASLDVLRGQEDEAKAALAQAVVGVDIAGKNLQDAKVHSPIEGVVEIRHVSAGQYVHVGEPIATIVDMRRLRLRFRVSESESVRLRIGQPITFRVQAFPEKTFTGEIFHVEATADPTSRMIECLATIGADASGLRPGFFASVRLEIAHNDDAFVVPQEAILASEHGFVGFLVDGNQARMREFTCGMHTVDGGVEILAGLHAGEQLIVQGAQMLQDGVPIEIVPSAPASEK